MAAPIPFFTLTHQNLEIEAQVMSFYKEIHTEAWYILGKHVSKFETAYSSYHQIKHTVGLGNGLDALYLALRALNIGKGDEVIVPANTFIATILAVIHTGATPVLVEPDARTYNIRATSIASFITSRTKAIIPVHLYGAPCEMDAILSLAAKHAIPIIEDNAQAHGATYLEKKTGTFGLINATSFYPVKPLGAYGDGGAITTNDDALAKKIRQLHNYGSEEKYFYETLGVNSRLDDIQAGILSIKLKELDRWNEERRILAHLYTSLLQGIEDVLLPTEIDGSMHIYHLYVIQTSKRDLLQQHLKRQGIETAVHYPIPPHMQKAYKFLKLTQGCLPVTEYLSSSVLSLPLYNGMNPDQIERVCAAIKEFY